METRPRRPWVLRNTVKRVTRKQAKIQRKTPTVAENALWQAVRGKRLGLNFKRQAIIRGYIVDFWCPAASLIVEIEGPTFDANRSQQQDVNLEILGLRVIRFTEDEVMNSLSYVLSTIRDATKNPVSYQISMKIAATFF